jgi:O-antigen ligase
VGSRLAVVWCVVVALDMVLLSNPRVLLDDFQHALRWSLVVTGCGVLLSLRRLRLPSVPWSIALFLYWALLSARWSIDSTATFHAMLLYAQITLIAVVVGANVDSLVCAAGLTLGGVVVVAASAYAFHEHVVGSYYATWQRVVFTGIGGNQNILAYTLVVALAACLSLGPPRRALGWVWWLGALGVIASGLVLARSATGLLSAGCVAGAWVALLLLNRITRWSRRRVALTTAIVLATAVVSAVALVVLLGKDVGTLSGRVPLWEATLRVTAEKPLVGFGWGAVWQSAWAQAPPNGVADLIYAYTGFRQWHGHNNFVQVAPELGIIGVLLAAAVLAHLGVKVFRRPRARRGPRVPDRRYRTLLALMLVAVSIEGLTEPLLTLPLGWWTVTLMLVVAPAPAFAERSAGRHRARTRPPDPVRSSISTDADDSPQVVDTGPRPDLERSGIRSSGRLHE